MVASGCRGGSFRLVAAHGPVIPSVVHPDPGNNAALVVGPAVAGLADRSNGRCLKGEEASDGQF